MVKFLPVALLLITLAATPATALKEDKETVKKPQISPTVKTEETCDPENDWKNHGDYVSCVAQQKLGGQTVSEAARSSIGKTNKNATGATSLTITPSSSPSATPSATLTLTPTPTSTDSARTVSRFDIFNQLKAIRELLQELTKSLKILR